MSYDVIIFWSVLLYAWAVLDFVRKRSVDPISVLSIHYINNVCETCSSLMLTTMSWGSHMIRTHLINKVNYLPLSCNSFRLRLTNFILSIGVMKQHTSSKTDQQVSRLCLSLLKDHIDFCLPVVKQLLGHKSVQSIKKKLQSLWHKFQNRHVCPFSELWTQNSQLMIKMHIFLNARTIFNCLDTLHIHVRSFVHWTIIICSKWHN